MKYQLSISVPAVLGFTTVAHFHSPEPFPRFSKDDMIDPRGWSGEARENFEKSFKYGDVFQVEAVYHHLKTNDKSEVTEHIIDLFVCVVRK